MVQPIRIIGLTPKPEKKPQPWIPSSYTLTIDLDGAARIYAEFWKPGIVGRRANDEITRRAIDALSADYYLKTNEATIPEAKLPYAYSCVLWDDQFPLACNTLLQLGIKSRLVIFVDKPLMCSLAVATDKKAIHVLRQFFKEVVPIRLAEFRRVQKGIHVRPRQLRRLSLPVLTGLSKPMPLPISVPTSESTSGDAIVLGAFLSPFGKAPAGPAKLPLQLLNKHVFVAGTTGSGKTNTVMRIVTETAPHVRGTLVFDVKREYRSLARTHGARVYNFNERTLFTHNLLKPEGPPARWAKEFARILAEVISKFTPATGTADLVAEEIDRLYRERGVYAGSTDYPHVGDLIEALERRAAEPGTSRERNWLSSGLRVLRTLRIGSTRQAFFVREGLALERLLQGVNVVELDGIGDPTATGLLVSVLLQKIRHKLETDEHIGLRNLIVVEEAQHVLAKGQESTSVITDTCREIRSYGVGLAFVTQMPSEFSKHAVANVNTLLVHKLVHPEDKWFTASLLGLQGQSRDLLEKLDVGQALMKTDSLSMVKVEHIDRPRVRDDELSQTVPNRQEVATDFAQRGNVQRRVVDLAPLDWEVLERIADGRAVNPGAVKDELHRSQADVTASLKRLLARGLVRYKQARRETGRPPSVYFLSPMGQEAFRARHGRYPDQGHAAAANHAELVQRVVEALGVARKPDRRFDVLYEENGQDRAVEVETGANNDAQVAENLRKSIELQGEGRFVVADRTIYNRVLQVAAKHSFDSGHGLVLAIALADTLTADGWDRYRFSDRDPTTP